MQAPSWLLAWQLSHVHTCNMSQICLLLGRLTTSKRPMHHCCQFTEISAKLFLTMDFSVCHKESKIIIRRKIYNIIKHLTANAQRLTVHIKYLQSFWLSDTFFKLAEKSSWVLAKLRGPHQFRHYNQTPGFVLEQLEPCMGHLAGFLYLTDKRAWATLNECKAVSGPDWGAIYLNQVQRWILCEL